MAFASRSNLKLTALALALASIGAQADTFTWASDTSGLWTLPVNWTPVGPPSQGGDVIISVIGLKTITHNAGADSIRTLNFEATATDPNATLLINGGSSLTVTSGGTNGGLISADAGTMSFTGGTLLNHGTVRAVNGGAVNIVGATVSGGMLSAASGGAVNLSNNAVLDGQTNGAITLNGNVVVLDNNVAYALGTINDNTLTVGTTGANGTDLRIQGNNNLTLANGSTTLINARLFGDNGNDLLTNAAGNTIQGYGNLGANQLVVTNAGLITANVNGQTLTVDATDGVPTAAGLINTGTMSATSGGTLQLYQGYYNNTGGTITATTGSSLVITNNANIQGGTVSTSGTGTATLSNSAVLDGQTHGAISLIGNIAVADNNVAYAYGIVNDNALTIGTTGTNSTDLRIQGTNNLTLANNGTTTLINARLFGDNGNDLLVNTAGNTIQGYGNLGSNQTLITNAGLITANVNGQLLTVDPSDGSSTAGGLVNTGAMRAQNGGSLQLLYGFYDNSAGSIQAQAGSTVTVTNSANIIGGSVSTQGNGQVNLYNSAVLDGQTKGAISLTGNVSIVDNNTVYALGTVNDNTLTVGTSGVNGTDLRILGNNNLTLANNGTTTLVNARLFGDNGNDLLTNTTGNTIQGYGNLGINQLVVANAGLITANIAGQTLTIDPSDGTTTAAGLVNTGTMNAVNGGTLQILGGNYNNAGGTITAATGSSLVITNSANIQGGTVSTSGTGIATLYNSAVLDGQTQGTITLAGHIVIADNNVVYALGTVNDNTLTVGTTGANGTDLRIQGNNNLTLANGSTTLINARLFGDNGNDVLTNTAGNTIQGYGNLGANQLVVTNAGLITANASGQTLVLDPSDGNNVTAGLVNTGTIRAEGGGALQILGGSYNNAGGTIAALNGSGVSITNGAQIEGGTLTTVGSGTITLSNSALLDGSAHGALTNTGALVFAAGQSVYGTGTIVDNGTVSHGAGTDFHIVGNSDLTLAGTGTYTLTDPGSRIFGDNGNDTLTNGAGHTIQGQGQIGINQMQLNNAGTINANVSGGSIALNTSSAVTNQSTGVLQASNGGTLNIDKAVNGTGTIRSDSGGTVVLNQASTTGQLINNGNLQINGLVTVSTDYNNANFGVGNAFNRNANVTGSGAIVASGNVGVGVTGANVTSLGPTASALTIGNVRVGANTFDYQVANTGTTGPAIRGAIQTQFSSGSGITDSRLSGSGVTAGNYGPVTAGGKSGDYAVTFTAANAGALAPLANSPGYGTGQAVYVASNFANVNGQVLQINLASGAAAYNAAVGSTSPSPIVVANQRVGGSGSQALTVANTAAAGNFSEALDASISGMTGAITSNAGSVSNIAAGASNTGALSVGVNATTSGAKTGNVVIAYQTDGTGSNGHSGLAAIGAGSQTIAVSGNVYQTAAGTLLTAPLNFGTVQVGQVVSQNLSIQNSATGAAGFVEDLNASFGAATGTGASRITGTGTVAGLAAGATSNGLTVGVNTSTAGTVNGSIAVNYFSAGTVNGVGNGLGTLAVGSSGYGVSGTIASTANVVDQAKPMITNGPITIGNVRIGATSPTGFVSVTNQATGNQQAALNASITGNAPVTASGSFNGLVPGATNATNLAVGIDTSTAGSKNGTATIAFVSDASNIGGCAPACQMTLASQDVTVNGAVYRLANPTVSSTPITVAARVGQASPTTAIGVTNASPDVYTEGLSVSRGATSAGFTSSGGITNLAAGGTSSAIGVTLNTATAGTFSGTQALNYVSTGAGTDGAADLSVGSGSVVLNGKVYTPAIAQNNTASVNFGIVHVGDAVAAQGVSVTNAAQTTALNDVLLASAVGATGPFAATGNLGAGLASQQTSANGLKVGLNTTAAGTYSGSATFSAASHDGDLTDAALANLAVSLVGQVNNYASDTFSKTAGAGTLTRSGSTFVLDYGTLTQNSGTVTSSLVASNDATGPADALNGMFQFLDPADFGESGFAAFTGLAAGLSDGPLSFSFSTATVGTFMDTIVLHGVGTNASGYAGALGDIQLIVRGTVDASGVTPPNGNVPEPDSLLLLGLGLPLLFLRRGRKTRAV